MSLAVLLTVYFVQLLSLFLCKFEQNKDWLIDWWSICQYAFTTFRQRCTRYNIRPLLSDACIHSNAFASKLWLNVCKCDLLACPDNKWYSFQFSFSFSFFFVPAVCIHVWSRAARSPTRNPARPTNTRVNPFTICRRHNPDVRPQWAETAATDYRAVCRRSVVYHDRRPAFIER